MRGIGKTRLARAAADRARHGFPHGVWFVEICGQTDPELLPHVVLHPLRAQDQTARPAAAALADYLADKRLLILLDLLDGGGAVTGACAALVRDLLEAAPGLHVLVTAQAPLGVPGERVRPVPPLDLPAPGADPAEAPAMRLLLARAAGPDSAGPDTTGPDRAGEAAGPADRRAVPPARRHPARDRARRRPARPPARGGRRRRARQAARAARGVARRDHPGAAAARRDRLDLRAVRAGRAAAVGGSVGVHRGLR